MPTIRFDGVSKRFGNTEVINEFHAEVPDREFLVLLGPSGCGKSTMLRMLAGLTDISEGDLYFDDEQVNELSPKQRDIAFVFQSYALYPHMTVRANIAFPLIMDRFSWWNHIPVLNGILKRARMRDPEISRKVEEVAEMLELTEYLDRRPKALSGGQRQRVAVARALVREPSIYLLDEPLSNLDAKLRTQMRAEISALHRRVGRSFVYVTHDQIEAMTMGTRIIVLNSGAVQQYGTPQEIYDRPANSFVARFIGSPPMNLVPVTLDGEGIGIPGGQRLPSPPEGAPAAAELLMGVRAEKVSVAPEDPQDGVTPQDDEAQQDRGALRARVTMVEHLGAETIVAFRLGQPEASEDDSADIADVHYAKVPGTFHAVPGQGCWVWFDLTEASWFDHDTGERLEPREAAEPAS